MLQHVVQPVAIPGASGAVGPTVDCAYKGITIAETAGAVAHVRIRAGSSSGTILDSVKLAAAASISLSYHDGRFAAGGLYYEKVAGTVEGSIFHA